MTAADSGGCPRFLRFGAGFTRLCPPYLAQKINFRRESP